jgi:hypothetical protein
MRIEEFKDGEYVTLKTGGNRTHYGQITGSDLRWLCCVTVGKTAPITDFNYGNDWDKISVEEITLLRIEGKI